MDSVKERTRITRSTRSDSSTVSFSRRERRCWSVREGITTASISARSRPRALKRLMTDGARRPSTMRRMSPSVAGDSKPSQSPICVLAAFMWVNPLLHYATSLTAHCRIGPGDLRPVILASARPPTTPVSLVTPTTVKLLDAAGIRRSWFDLARREPLLELDIVLKQRRYDL